MTKEDLKKAVDSVLGNKDGVLDEKDIMSVVFKILGFLVSKKG